MATGKIDDKRMRKPVLAHNSLCFSRAAGIFISFFVIGSLASLIFPHWSAGAADDVMVVETEVSFDQIVDDQKVKTIKPSVPMAAFQKAEEREAEKVKLKGEEIIRINSSLRRAIEENARLTQEKETVDQDLGRARGQRNIQANRAISLGEERDKLQELLKNVTELEKTIGEPFDKYYARMQEQQTLFEQEVNQLKTQLVEAEDKVKALAEENVALYGTKDEITQTTALSTVDEPEGAAEKKSLLVAEYQLKIETLKTRLAEAEDKAKKLEEENMALSLLAKPEAEEAIQEKEIVVTELPAPGQAPAQAIEVQKEEEAASLAKEPEGGAAVVPVPAAVEFARDVSKDKALAETAGESAQKEISAPAQTVTAVAKVVPSKSQSAEPAPKRTVEVQLQEEVSGARDKSLAVIELIEKLDKDNERLKIDEAKVHYNMGNTFFNQGKYRRAVKEYQLTINLMPKDANAHFNLAFVSGEYLRDTKTALKHYKEYLMLRPNAEDAALVKEKIVEAELYIRSIINTSLEGDWKKHEARLYQE